MPDGATARPPFSLGVASFDPQTDRVLLWTRVDGAGPAGCRWEVADDASFAEPVAAGEAPVDPDTGIVTVDVGGLSPGTRYWYRFVSGAGATSPVGRTRTLPGPGAERLRVAAVCCARYGGSAFTVYAAAAGADVDVVLHLGDYIYEDTKCTCEGREPEPDHECLTLDDYRTRHAQARRDPDLQALHAAHPMVSLWDDHDLADNAWRGGAHTHDPDEHGPWPERLGAALRAHNEFLPKRLADPDDPTSAWRRLDAGDLVSIVCTEGRAQRDEPAGVDRTLDADDPARTLLGPAQAAWLREAVADGSVRWTLLLSGTVVSELVIETPDVLDGMMPEKYAVVDGHAVNTDQWDGYLAERRQLAAALAQRPGGALIVSGDIHSSWAVEGPLGPDGVPVAVELVCPPAATTPLGQLLPPGVGALLGPAIAKHMPRVRWVDADHRGYLTLDIGRDRAEAAWWWVEPGEAVVATRARRWSVPWVAPMGLVDPEPVGSRADEAASPLSAVRGRRRRRVVVLLAALAATAVGVGAAVVTRRRAARHRSPRWRWPRRWRAGRLPLIALAGLLHGVRDHGSRWTRRSR
jgi:alkaline phosphatase D